MKRQAKLRALKWTGGDVVTNCCECAAVCTRISGIGSDAEWCQRRQYAMIDDGDPFECFDTVHKLLVSAKMRLCLSMRRAYRS